MNTLADLKEVHISRKNIEQMLAFSRTVMDLSANAAYAQSIQEHLPETANAMSDEAPILMGFDFHITDDGPKLIEINNNAGGLFAGDSGWIAQDDAAWEEWQQPLPARLLSMFPASWQSIAIMDEAVDDQYMYPEMQAYAALLRQDGRQVCLVSPEDIREADDGLYVGTQRLDGIYNRHCDFYLESDAMAHIRRALMSGLVRLNPYPRSYAFLGHKARMVDWWRDGVLEGCMPEAQVRNMRHIVPRIHAMSAIEREEWWRTRKQWVFKPEARHGGKGVLLGKGMSRKRFDGMDASDTVVQELVPASVLEHEGRAYKFDIRLYMYGHTLVALAGRLWRGQVTNFREEGSGWTSIRIDDEG